jgi:hypothetical protein
VSDADGTALLRQQLSEHKWRLAPTYGDLFLNPCWDDLRGDRRFDKIVAAAKAASK